ncbi:4-hydroxy-3-methylbut-2-enyl diphosphate reductase [Kibdelosporangium banguiense]|uniref:4-hydroxy-3-methylbut-2-enyl diphosphate reductase n=1 Tax=Kibdelosporangium banguiense TaxID=1365924 RepID=A0ABS4TR29_9PSEU|nr:4-hydroxy-3-methylbut-2-enyl diphosphate reductase [Kibdelosporangium banguiense]MBP2326439.1 4-hydroxy-3-methylbut-2-enyl diphosphate reductase [Kibdelosporangium banguiense]
MTTPVVLCELAAESAATVTHGVTMLAGAAGSLLAAVEELNAGAVAVRGRPSPAGVTIAAEVTGPGWGRRCPSAPILAGEFRRRGCPATVVRTHTDPDTAELTRQIIDSGRPAVLVGGEEPAVLTALSAWGAAAGSRRILLAGPRSFCAGVERAIEIVDRALTRHGRPVYVRKQIVHNLHVVQELEQRGAIFVDELAEVPTGSVVVFSAHGVSPAVRLQALDRRLQVVDATCPLVTKVHSEAKRFAARGDTIVLVGHAGHEESEGTLGEAPDRTVLVQNEQDVDRLEIDGPVSYLTQTTLAVDEAGRVVDALRARYPHLTGPSTEDICYATTNRQDALRAVVADADLVLVIGSVNSSNSVRLVELAHRHATAAHLIDDASDIDPAWLAGVHTVGLTAGASVPPRLVTEVIGALGGFGETTVQERQVAAETIRFGLPKDMRTEAGGRR